MIHTLLSKIVTLITAPVFLIGSLLTPATVQTPQANLGASLPQAVGIFETSLASPISASATSFTLSQNAIRGGGTLSGYNCFTIDEGTSQAEIACGTVSSTAVTSVTRGISYEDGVTSVAGNKFAHRRGANVKITDYPVLQILKAQNNGEYTFPNALIYDGSQTFSTSTQIVSKGYVDGVAIAGGADASTSAKGISKLSYAPASSTNPIAVGDNDPRVPTQGENDALAGTSGTPSSSNKYVTSDDVSATSTISKIVRADGTGKIDSSWLNASSLTHKGGDGSDGSLSCSSGTTNIDLGGAKIVIKNYTSISITGTCNITFSNSNSSGTQIIFRSQGAVTITSSASNTIDLRSLGSSAGTGGTRNATTPTNGTDGTVPIFYHPALVLTAQSVAGKGLGGAGAPPFTGGASGGTVTTYAPLSIDMIKRWLISDLFVGATSGGGGGGGGAISGGGTGGNGGAGGIGSGNLIIESATSITFTTGTINASGTAGTAGVNATGGTYQAGGGGAGGGGAGGIVIFQAPSITSSGTVTVSGGAGGGGGNALNQGVGNGCGGAGGAGGSNGLYAGGAGGDGGCDAGAHQSSSGSSGLGASAGAGGSRGTGDHGSYGSGNTAGAGGGGGGGASGLYIEITL